jgi:hypothetical protein
MAKQPSLRPILPHFEIIEGSTYQAGWMTIARGSAKELSLSSPTRRIEVPYLPLYHSQVR